MGKSRAKASQTPRTFFKARELKAIQDKYYDQQEPPICLPNSHDHPLYYKKSNLIDPHTEEESLLQYSASASSFSRHWIKKGKKAQCAIVLLRQLYFMQNDQDLSKVARVLKQVLKDWFKDYAFDEFLCEIEGTNLIRPILLPTNIPLSKLDFLILSFRNIIAKDSCWKSTTVMTIILDYQGPGQENIVANNEARTLAEIKAAAPENPFRLYLKKELSIQRSVYFGGGGFRSVIYELSRITLDDYWGPFQWILKNFVNQTFVRQLKEGNVVPYTLEQSTNSADEKRNLYACNMNLLNKGYSQILMVLEAYNKDAFPHPPEYAFVKFVDVKPCVTANGQELFPRPKWNAEKDDLFFDPSIPIEPNYNHVFNSNKSRIEKCFKAVREITGPIPSSIELWFSNQLNSQLLHVNYNWRFPVPQIFNEEEIQLLIPFFHNNVVVLVITLKKETKDNKKRYVLNTILEPMWAYNNARVLSYIESNWLSSIIMREEVDEDPDLSDFDVMSDISM